MNQLKPNAERAKKARNLLMASVGIAAVFLLQSIYEFYELSSLQSGRNFNPDVYFSKRDPLAFLQRISTVVTIVTIVYFIQWFRRAYYNLHLLRNDLTYSESTAAWSWFVPIFNLFAPFIIMRELVAKTTELLEQGGTEPAERIKPDSIAAWWFTYWGTLVVIIIAILFVIGLDYNSVRIGLLLSLLGQAMNIVSGLLVIQIISKYSKNEALLSLEHTEIDEIGKE